MPVNSRSPLVNLDFATIHSIDTTNLSQIHSLWSVFNKCADSMADGKRLENLSWRIYSRETFCCAPDRSLSPRLAFDRKRKDAATPKQLPELSSSLESNSSDDVLEISSRLCPSSRRPQQTQRQDSSDSRSRKEKHITSIDLEKIVNTIKEKKDLAPLSPLPSSLTPTAPVTQMIHETAPLNSITSPPSPSPSAPSASTVLMHSKASTVGTLARSEVSDMSPPFASPETNATELSSTSIVRGFSKDHISSSARSRVNLVPVQSSQLMNTSATSAQPVPKRNAPKFVLGGSSGEGDESSLESRFLSTSSSLATALKNSRGGKPESKKMTSFNEEVATRTIQDRPYESEEVFEDTDDEDEDQSESAIEDDDVDEEWEDDDEPSSPPSLDKKHMFQRVDSKPNLISRRSMLTSLMHEKDRAGALLHNANSRSSPAIRRSRTTSPNGPLGTSPPKSIAQGLAQPSRARPIIMTTSNTHPPALSPRTTRRNMLSTELTESLRKHLLWERQVKSSTTNAALKRRHTAHDMKNLQHYPGENHATTFLAPAKEAQATNSWNNYFDSGLQEYHQKGW
ncbi:DUF1752-domain-containing protein [Tothia fuscella]|uniref:DUF1752-domain-containing protein n=1 Tax=Tothia fuscella TaxID=1048955 RepID=A0A9P4U1X1_9PEZI|nr:DUF1752-domain-containing protein [Tothia fuscella]